MTSEKINSNFIDFIMLIVSALQFDYESNICKRLYHVACQVLKHWATASTGVWVFGSVMEV
jgi:hypothetical protein